MRRASLLAAASLALGACAPTTSTGSLPLEVLVVLDSLDHTLRMIPVDSPTVVREIDLGGALGFTPSFLAARGRKAVVAGNDGSTARIAIVDLAASGIQDIVTLLDGQIAAVAIADDDHAFIGSWTSGAISRISGSAASSAKPSRKARAVQRCVPDLRANSHGSSPLAWAIRRVKSRKPAT